MNSAIWFETLRNGGGTSPLGERLPDLPDEAVQSEWRMDCSPHRLVMAFEIHRYLRENHWPAVEKPKFLEFNAGWAPMARCFLRDITADRIWTVDGKPGFRAIAEGMNFPFHALECAQPARNLPEFDLIFCQVKPDPLWLDWLKSRLSPQGTLAYLSDEGGIRLPLQSQGLTVIRNGGGGRVPEKEPPRPERVCHIHAGIHKTGSTAIQEFLFRNREAFAQRGVHVCRAGSPWAGMSAHHNLAYEANRTPQFQAAHGTLGQLMKELQGIKCSRAVISSEEFGFTLLDPEACARLAYAVHAAGFTPRWILYFRPFPDWADSAYSEICKGLLVQAPFGAWWNSEDGQGRLRLGRYPYSPVGNAAARGEEVDVRSYALAARSGLMNDFQRALGIKDFIVEEGPPPSSNDRAQFLQVEFYRMCSFFVHRYGLVQEISNRIGGARRLAATLPTSAPYCGLNEALAQGLREHTDEAYQVLLTLTGQSLSLEEFFPRKTFEKQDFLWDQTTPEHRVALFQSLAAFMDASPPEPEVENFSAKSSFGAV